MLGSHQGACTQDWCSWAVVHCRAYLQRPTDSSICYSLNSLQREWCFYYYLSDCVIQPSSCHITINWLIQNQTAPIVRNDEVRRITKQPNLTPIIHAVTAPFHIWAYCMYEWWRRCPDDSNSSPTKQLEETTRASSYHVAEHRPAQSERLQPHTERSSRPGPEPFSVEADVYSVVHANTLTFRRCDGG